jgi:hypothetical protein
MFSATVWSNDDFLAHQRQELAQSWSDTSRDAVPSMLIVPCVGS